MRQAAAMGNSEEQQKMYADVENKVLALVEGIALRKVTLDELLLDSGLVDSITAVDLVLQVEVEMGVEIPAEKIHEHLRTTRSLVSYVIAAHH